METFLGRGIEERYHCRVNAPKGHYISKVEVVDSGNEKKRIPIKGTHDNLKQQSDLQQEIIDLRIRSFPENKTYIIWTRRYLSSHEYVDYNDTVISKIDDRICKMKSNGYTFIEEF